MSSVEKKMTPPSKQKIESAMLTESEHFTRSRIQQLERKIQEMAIHEDIVQAELEKLREQAQLVPQLRALSEQLKQDNANLCADLESAQTFLRQHDVRRDNIEGQRDKYQVRNRRLEDINKQLRSQLSVANADLKSATERASSLRDSLSDALRRGVELEKLNGGGRTLAEDSGIFGEALLQRLEEQESELLEVKAAAARTRTRYILREPTGPWEVATLDEVTVMARHGDSNKGKGRSSVFASRRAAEAQGQLSKLILDHKQLLADHSAMDQSHNSLVEETEMLRRELENRTKSLRNAKMHNNFKLAAQKASLTKQRLTRNLYMSRGMIDMGAPSASVLAGRATRYPERAATGKSGLRIAAAAFSGSRDGASDMPPLASSSMKLNAERQKKSVRIAVPTGHTFLLDETPSPRSGWDIVPTQMNI